MHSSQTEPVPILPQTHHSGSLMFGPLLPPFQPTNAVCVPLEDVIKRPTALATKGETSSSCQPQGLTPLTQDTAVTRNVSRRYISIKLVTLTHTFSYVTDCCVAFQFLASSELSGEFRIEQGRGLFALAAIEKRGFVLEYKGELISERHEMQLKYPEITYNYVNSPWPRRKVDTQIKLIVSDSSPLQAEFGGGAPQPQQVEEMKQSTSTIAQVDGQITYPEEYSMMGRVIKTLHCD
ncbi:hypothetical protein AAFF_G00107970 [Aldrovandia affinis]|uniref:Uncharacterized protein n=1 Tax=Aldrovandia affinis TaxID=143900 RepID=A0AAD7WBB3_9TELE|nr:hypothetical protein AAFF_G00107970 [Aldrovandia affinis]